MKITEKLTTYTKHKYICKHVTDNQNTIYRYIVVKHCCFGKHSSTTLLTIHLEDGLCGTSWLPSMADSAQHRIIILFAT